MPHRYVPHCYLSPGRVTFPPFYPSQLKLLLAFATPQGCKAELTKLAWLHTEVVYPPEYGYPTQVRFFHSKLISR